MECAVALQQLPHLWCQRLAQLVECGGGGELEIGLLIELVRPDVPIGRRGRSCEIGKRRMAIHSR